MMQSVPSVGRRVTLIVKGSTGAPDDFFSANSAVAIKEAFAWLENAILPNVSYLSQRIRAAIEGLSRSCVVLETGVKVTRSSAEDSSATTMHIALLALGGPPIKRRPWSHDRIVSSRMLFKRHMRQQGRFLCGGAVRSQQLIDAV